jgi:UDP-N-acetylmuramoyl-tripeptide--D-alanyl-D-alanine ligase
LTGINKQHLSLFGSLENIKSAKYELIEGLLENGKAFFNVNNPYVQQLSKKEKHIENIFYGKSLDRTYKTNIIGDFQQINIDGAVKVAQELNLNLSTIKNALKNIPENPYLVQLRNGRNGVKIIDDSYNSNPSGFKEALQILKNRPEKNKIVVTPGIIELGSEVAKIHKELNKIITQIADKVFLLKKDFSKYLDGEVVNNPGQIKNKLKDFCNSDTVILLEGRIYSTVKKFLLKNE